MSKSSTKIKLDGRDVDYLANFLRIAEQTGISLEAARSHFMSLIRQENAVKKFLDKEKVKQEGQPGRPEFG